MLTGFSGSSKVLVIEPAEAMTTAAANALLKTLEEPPEETYLLLVSSLPGRLPATVRSRCQHLVLKEPSPRVVEDWFVETGVGAEALRSLREMTGSGPLGLLDAIEGDLSGRIDDYADCLAGVHAGKLDPFEVADEWSKADLDHVLSWTVRSVQLEIRSRFLAMGSNPVTVSGANALHNIFPELTLRSLFEQLDKAEALREQLGSGINIGLGLQVLLLGFRAH